MATSRIAWGKQIRTAMFLSLFWTWSCFALDVSNLPKPTGYVSDFAHVVDAESKAQLEDFCSTVEQQLGVQFALVTVNTVGDRPIRDVALEISRKWGVGDRKSNQGVFLLLATQDRKNDIETGRGIEPYLTDGFSGGTLRSMRPELRAGNYGAALLTAAQEMASQIAQGKGIAFSATPQRSLPRRETSPPSRGIPFPLIIIGIFVLLWLFSRGGRRGGGMYGGGGGGSFLTGMLLGNLLGGGRRGGGGVGWGGGGFGGDSGGSGGFGGFGGGDFGGGGASSDW